MTNEVQESNTTETTTATVATDGSQISTESSSQDWRTTLPEDLRADPALQSFKSITDLAKSQISAQRMIGSRIPIPTKDASKETIEEFYNKLQTIPDVVRLPQNDDPEISKKLETIYDRLGRPKTPSEYSVDLPENVALNPDYVDAMANLAHKVGITQSQWNALLQAEAKLVSEQLQFQNKVETQNKEFLHKVWGQAFDNNKNLAANVINKLIEKYPEQFKTFSDTEIANSPLILMLASEMGKLSGEESTVSNRSSSNLLTPEQAQQRIDDMLRNRQHPINDAAHPDHAKALAEKERLYDLVYGSNKETS